MFFRNLKKIQDQIGHIDLLDKTVEPDSSDHDYIRYCWELTPFVENIVLYIADYIAYKVSKTIFCPDCRAQLTSDVSSDTMPLLNRIKNKGPFTIPSMDVCKICKISEKVIREYSDNLLKPNIKTILINNICRKISIIFDNKEMNEHILSQNILENHRSQLCKWIIELSKY